ncbi:2-hydroxyacyl-CoA dehydratase [Clostridium botulinum]|uniref:double-cubane-cluster-containing anaerobic reductase n=1 Tax=Clostridium botulinum TaxID=1491 RepID=UPI001A913DD2|nr:double-cubane-cluster-containing anaerobic reductase [Clostridium botulinum]EKO1914213.1 2-hydroxyacyl-CoA dehydratase [Clostridium botulinum]EKO2044267.1 2-hydroxyacyl-CoA dehydratase [Clostridium botulinum]MBO0526728.1 2-hydroxyacyl-CoA dehydratase [Clostridium botulinum]MBO0526950.1 2-hydroxyacyl-CoA dehydratase [Clostridium botulinum]MBO0533407.1 2-hydroxyacyl-CoA dehydratase [Clostridium botulinum]
MNQLPKNIDKFGEARRKGFVKIKELKDSGYKIAGEFCAYTPWEIIAASGAIPVGLCGTSEEPIEDAEKHLPRNLCPLIKSSYGFALTEKCPYMYFSDVVIGETTCDGKKKMYELLSKMKRVHIMQLPQTQNTEDAFKLWRNEVIKLKKFLEKEFNVEITEEKIKEMIKIKNKERQSLRNFYELGRLNPPPLTGMEILKVLRGAGFTWDKEDQVRSIDNIVEEVKKQYEMGKTNVAKDSKRILVTGCPLGEATDKIINTIEENGGVVVAYENCGGAKNLNYLVDESKEPIDALTEKYLNIACSCMSPNNKRIDLISEIINDYKIDGVVDVILQACHTYNIETTTIKEFVTKEKNIPYISIETDYSQKDIGQLKTRLAAFIEIL